MIAAGEITDGAGAADVLADVAVAIGLTPTEVQATIRSGFSTSEVYL